MCLDSLLLWTWWEVAYKSWDNNRDLLQTYLEVSLIKSGAFSTQSSSFTTDPMTFHVQNLEQVQEVPGISEVDFSNHLLPQSSMVDFHFVSQVLCGWLGESFKLLLCPHWKLKTSHFPCLQLFHWLLPPLPQVAFLLTLPWDQVFQLSEETQIGMYLQEKKAGRGPSTSPFVQIASSLSLFCISNDHRAGDPAFAMEVMSIVWDCGVHHLRIELEPLGQTLNFYTQLPTKYLWRLKTVVCNSFNKLMNIR